MYMYNLQSEWPFLVDLWTVISRNIILFIIHRIVFVFRSVKFLLSFVGETIHCPFHVFFNLSKKNSPQQSLQNFAVSMDFSILVHGIFFGWSMSFYLILKSLV